MLELSGCGNCANRSGALRGAGNTKIPLMINGGMNISSYHQQHPDLRGFLPQGLALPARGWDFNISRYIGARGSDYLGADDWF